MIIEPERMFQLIVHCGLLLVKTYSIYFFARQILLAKTPNGSSMMFIFKPIELSMLLFSVVTVLSELYYLSYFFVNTTLYFYEAIAVFDEILFTILVMIYLKKGGAHGG